AVNTGSVVKWGAIGLGAWWVYRNYFTAPVPGVVTVAPLSTPASAPAPSTPTASFNTLDAIYSRFAAAAGPEARTADQFNVFLKQVSSLSPDPAVVFTQAGFDRNAAMTPAQYWSAVAAHLAGTGMKGLGHFAGLGALYLGGGR